MNDIMINKSRPPLRWIANLFGDVAGWAIMRISYHDELKYFGWQYKLHSAIWKVTWPVYYKFGTFYIVNLDMNGDGWNDYDENGHPYWFYTEWQEDPETGDAWRLVRKDKEGG
jgi:hypothetical protein